MQNVSEIFYTFWIPVLFIILGVLFILGKIGPNHFVGIRVKKSFTSVDIWYKIHTFFGWILLIDGIILFIYRIMEPYIYSLQGNFKGALSFLIIITIIVINVYMNKIKK